MAIARPVSTPSRIVPAKEVAHTSQSSLAICSRQQEPLMTSVTINARSPSLVLAHYSTGTS